MWPLNFGRQGESVVSSPHSMVFATYRLAAQAASKKFAFDYFPLDSTRLPVLESTIRSSLVWDPLTLDPLNFGTMTINNSRLIAALVRIRCPLLFPSFPFDRGRSLTRPPLGSPRSSEFTQHLLLPHLPSTPLQQLPRTLWASKQFADASSAPYSLLLAPAVHQLPHITRFGFLHFKRTYQIRPTRHLDRTSASLLGYPPALCSLADTLQPRSYLIISQSANYVHQSPLSITNQCNEPEVRFPLIGYITCPTAVMPPKTTAPPSRNSSNTTQAATPRDTPRQSSRSRTKKDKSKSPRRHQAGRGHSGNPSGRTGATTVVPEQLLQATGERCDSPLIRTTDPTIPEDLSAIMHDDPCNSPLPQMDCTFDQNLSVILDPPALRPGHNFTRDPLGNDDTLQATPIPPNQPQTGPKKASQKSVEFPPGTPYGQSKVQHSVHVKSDREVLFCQVKLTTEGRSFEDLTARLTVIIKNLVNLNIDFQLLCFDAQEQLPPVTKCDSIGTKLTQLQRYFHGVYMATTSWSQWRVSWVPPYLGYTSTHFLTDANAVLSEFNSNMYSKWLQLPFTATAGWIFKSTEHTDLATLKLFLESELRDHYNFEGPIALYRKTPFTGAATNPGAVKGQTSQTSGRAIHVDTIDYLHTVLWQKLSRLLKSDHIKRLHNFEWKFIPQYHARRAAEDQNNLKMSAAKQKLVPKAIVTLICDYFLDVDLPVSDDGMTLRRFFLDQRMPGQGPPIVLAVDRSEKGTDEYIFTSAKEHSEALSQLVKFSPLLLSRVLGEQIRRKLSIYGIEALEDQYWDNEQQMPRSRFSDTLRDDHLDDRDIRIEIINLPESVGGVKRPGDTAGLDIDEITQASYNTTGQSKTKQPRFTAPQPEPGPTEEMQQFQAERIIQNQKIAALEAQLAHLMHASNGHSPTAVTPLTQLDASP